MSIPRSHLVIQCNRLRRHLRASLKGDDHVAFLDLAHVLRVWTELADAVADVCEELELDLTFRHNIKNRRKRNILRGVSSWQLDFPVGPGKAGGDMLGFVVTSPAGDPGMLQSLFDLGIPRSEPRRMTLSDWWGAEVGETVDATTEPETRLGFPRAVLVKRIANRLGASHPIGMDDEGNRYDPHVNLFHTMKVMGDTPLTYYALICIGNDLVAGLDPLMAEIAGPLQPAP